MTLLKSNINVKEPDSAWCIKALNKLSNYLLQGRKRDLMDPKTKHNIRLITISIMTS